MIARKETSFSLKNTSHPQNERNWSTKFWSILRPSLTYACPIWIDVSKTSLQKILTSQKKYARIATKAPWFIKNEQIHRESRLQPVLNYIRDLTRNYMYNLEDKYLSIGALTINVRLKPRLPQDIAAVF